ncbi:MAG: DinB family protein [Lewinellaceae bacterium]|nr:DinB family protein [Lewinellaceae bacterium]
MYSKHWTEAIDQNTQDFQRAFGKLTPKELNWKPASDRWSIAQCIDHIMVINQTYFPVVQALREGTYQAPWHGRFSFLCRFFGNLVLQSVQPTQTRKTKTFPIWEPGQSELPGDILARFAKHQGDLKKMIQSSEELVARRAVISSPANRTIVYHLGMAFEIIVAHEKRHFNQAWEVLNLQKEAK